MDSTNFRLRSSFLLLLSRSATPGTRAGTEALQFLSPSSSLTRRRGSGWLIVDSRAIWRVPERSGVPVDRLCETGAASQRDALQRRTAFDRVAVESVAINHPLSTIHYSGPDG